MQGGGLRLPLRLERTPVPLGWELAQRICILYCFMAMWCRILRNCQDDRAGSCNCLLNLGVTS